MAEDTITIEVDGASLPARKGQMLIEVTDANGSYVPRFCYHHKLSVAANCRMCLVEVEKAPKPLPACATPVMPGMVVKTRSKLALEAQKSVMEFLLINHPLDCPICDQGGECELQDLAMGYGSDVSRYQEGKRVVVDKNIGPLVQTDMTRCIHCTRCVRFGEEIAGLRELGATGRGEDMEIGTYIEKSMASELSGNVIDLCPVGALTSKPFRYSARTWEMQQHPGIAAHDAVGSNLYFHIKDGRVKRIVPAENEAINEVWLSDRDRFSYEGLYSAERLTVPMVKEDGSWREVDWPLALQAVKGRLGAVIESQGPQQLGALISPTSTTEEAYLLQKLVRALGCPNIDHRLRQSDFSDQESAPRYPTLGMPIADSEHLDAALIVGGHPRKEQPLLNHRLRKAALRGAEIMFLHAARHALNFTAAAQLCCAPGDWVNALAGIAKALLPARSDAALEKLLAGVVVSEAQGAVAERLRAADNPGVFLGSVAMTHPQLSSLRYLAGQIAAFSSAGFGYLGEAANTLGMAVAAAVPDHSASGSGGAHGGKGQAQGLSALAMLEQKLSAYLLLNVEPELDCCDGRLALEAMQAAQHVIAITPYRSAGLEDYADVLLPLCVYAENTGSYINIEGRRQHFTSAVAGPGESRPGWKILRVLADGFGLDGFPYHDLAEVAAELDAAVGEISAANNANANVGAWRRPKALGRANGKLQRITTVPMNAGDGLLRRAAALQQTAEVADGTVHINWALAERLGVKSGDTVKVTQEEHSLELPLRIDPDLADETVLIHAGHPASAGLGAWFGEIALERI